MKIFLTSLVAIFLGFGGFLPAHSSAPLIERTENLSIVITDQYSPTKNEVINDVLTLQQSLIIPLQIPIPEENAQNGYLLIKMTPQYVHNLLEQKNGLIVGAYREKSLMGYILLIDISEFQELYQDQTIGYIETPLDLTLIEKWFSQSTVGYVEQIGVKPGHSKTGIGTHLINASKKLKSGGLVADVFLEPLNNEASIQFFSRTGFKKSGILHQHPRSNFPHAHRTQVFFWNYSN